MAEQAVFSHGIYDCLGSNAIGPEAQLTQEQSFFFLSYGSPQFYVANLSHRLNLIYSMFPVTWAAIEYSNMERKPSPHCQTADVTSKCLNIKSMEVPLPRANSFVQSLSGWWLQGIFLLWLSVIATICWYALVCSSGKVLTNSHTGFYGGSFRLPSSFLLYWSRPHPCTSHLGSSSDFKGLSKYNIAVGRQQQQLKSMLVGPG